MFYIIDFPFPLSDTPGMETGIVSYYEHSVDSPIRLPILPGKDFLGLYFNLKEELRYTIGKQTKGSIESRCHNVVYLPHDSCEYTLEKGSYATFCIRFTLKYLKLRAEHLHFKKLDYFLDLAESGIAATLNKSHLFATSEMVDIIRDILFNKFTGNIRDVYIKAKTNMLLDCCLDHSQKMFYAHIPGTDLAKLKEAYYYILENLHKQLSVALLAEEFDIDQRRFENRFNIVFGKTVYRFIVNERMKKAKRLFAKTTMPANEIALAVGYKRYTTFSELFMRTFGYTATVFRQAVENGVDYDAEV